MSHWHYVLISDMFCLFKHSLATLRECTIERGEGGSHDEAAVTSVSVHSVISAIPSQEIQRMVQEVKTLDEETLKVKKTSETSRQ